MILKSEIILRIAIKILSMLIGLISDTHITEKRGKLKENVLDEFDCVDMIVHAGDITHEKVLDELEKIAPVIAVRGNNDKLDLNETEILEIGNFKIAVNHGTRYSDDFHRLHKLACDVDADVLITGHTHKPHCKIIGDVLLINPGSSNRPIKSESSVAIMNIGDGYRSVGEIEVTFIEV